MNEIKETAILIALQEIKSFIEQKAKYSPIVAKR